LVPPLVLGLAVVGFAVLSATGRDILRDLRPVAPPARTLPAVRSAYAPEVLGTDPARPKAVLHVGDEREFAVVAVGPDLHFGWTIDGAPAGTGPRWTYTPRPSDVGRRRLEVA